MAHAPDLSRVDQDDLRQDFCIEFDDQWASWVPISGGLGLLLSVHLQTSTPSFHMSVAASGQLCEIITHVDQMSSPRGYLESIYQTHQGNFALSGSPQVFWLRTDSSASVPTPGGSFDLGPGDNTAGSGIPSQIRCTIIETHNSFALHFEVKGDYSECTFRFLCQLEYISKQLLSTTTNGSTLKELDLICDKDRRDLQRWNQQPPSTVMCTIPELFRQRVLDSPESPAVQSWDGVLTYTELDIFSSQLSSKLQEAGACLGQCIPLCFEKSVWTVVGMLGVLKAGCSFLLMDVSHPTNRLQTLSSEVNATLILSSVAQKGRAAQLAPKVIVVSNDVTQQTTTNAHHEIEVDPSAVAAVVFTSGTTGTPKGIQIEHRSICSSLLALAKLGGVNRQTRYYQFSSYAFDAGFGEIVMTLISGGCICVPSDEDRLNNLAKSICAFNATAVLLTPTVVRLLSPSDVPCLRTLISGGERVTQDIVKLWGSRLDLVIVYGPAETTVACVAKKALPPVDSATRVGFPLNSRVWIALLDNPNKLAPVGAVGELVVEGPGIARNYINSHLDSANLFSDSTPWAKSWEMSLTQIERCYRTGDMAYFTEDGEIVFVGRRDRQIKLRGQRIELEDIENKLQKHNQISETRIILELIHTHGQDSLVAFLHAPALRDIPERFLDGEPGHMTEQMELEIEKLRVRMAEELPAYMWPGVWIPLQDLPLSPTGKLDRRELVRRGQNYCSNMQTDTHEQPGLPLTESNLARMWRQILNFATPNLHSDAHFFRLGGDSLSSMRLVTLANKENYHLTMEKVFRNPTLCDMAIAMQRDLDTDSPSNMVTRVPFYSREETDQIWSLLEDYGLIREQVASILPCTALQEGMFSLSLALPSLYSSQFLFKLPSTVDLELFKVACARAIEAYPILRTAIVPSSSNLLQVVLRNGAEWTEVNQDIVSFLSADQAVSFDLGQPLNKLHHVHDPSTNLSHLVWTLHHAVYDGWSLEHVVETIRQSYYRHSRETGPQGTFEDFVQFCYESDQRKSELFWTEQLEFAPTPSFPNYSRAGHLAADDSSLRYTITPPTDATPGVTTTILARATWALLLSEYEGSDDVTFGNSLHGRNSLPHHLQHVVGPTVTTLPVRVKIDRTQTIRNFLDDLQVQFLAMIPHEQFGLSQILAISHDVKNSASIRTLLIVQIASTSSLEEKELRLEEVERSLHEYPLVLTLEPEGSKIELVATYDSATLSSSQVQRIVQQFEQTFNEICSVPTDTRVGDLDLASEADKSAMFQWNAKHHKALDVGVHDLIHEQVKRDPTSQAICSSHVSLSYAELDRLSDNLAGEVGRLGLGLGSVVGILFDKSHWAIVSILAIIKAGCAFAPLSPTNPRNRLEDIAREAEINVVLCSPTQEARFPSPPWQTIVVTDHTVRSFQSIAQAEIKFVSPECVLYVLSTSGTTGIPKVFAVQHKSFATGAIARAPLIKRGPQSRVLQFAPYVFDPSVEDILTTLMFGGCICVPSDEDIMGDISAYMKAARVNFANITPSVAHTLRHDELPDLKILLLSGEAPDQALVDKWDGRVHLMNGYGPSECSVKCSINCHLSRDDPRNIGHSIGTSLWVVKPTNHYLLTPLGGVGELVIESPNLARGYLNRTTSTEERFVTSPPWLRSLRYGHEAPIYKTGDLVRQREDGSIVYIGRADLQLKLRGQRLEGEEVRQRIQECLLDEQLQVIVDIARLQGQDEDTLVAYLARESAPRAATVDKDPVLQQRLMTMKESLLLRLRSVLPEYMIPSVFLAVTNIPVTANGKTDRRVLKAQTLRQRLEPQLLLAGNNFVEKVVSENEKILHSLWQRLLGLDRDRFGANAHFFELGGSSLTTIKLSAAIRDLGYSLPAQQIFRQPVLSAMAAQMKPLKKIHKIGPAQFSLLGRLGRSIDDLWDCLCLYDIKKEGIEDAYPCTRIQRMFTREEMIAPGGNTFQHIVPLPTDIDLVRFTSALERILRTSTLLRTRFVQLSSEIVQIVLKDESIYSKIEFLTPLGFENRKTSWRWDLGQPQSRFSIIDGGDSQSRYFAWSCTHAMFDPWSRKMLLEDLDFAYHNNSTPPVRPQYNHFIEYVYDLDSKRARCMLAQEAENENFFNFFEFDGTRVPQVTHRLSLDVAFPASLPSGMSYATVMVTVWVIVAAHVEGHNRFLFNIMFGGRDADFSGIESLMGPSLTTAPLSTDIDVHATIRRNVGTVQDGVDEAASIQHSPVLDDKLQQLLETAPLVIVNPSDDYVEIPTKHLGLIRSRAEVRPSADALVMNFCLHTGNSGVDLLAEIDPEFFPVDKAIQYFGYMEKALMHIFSPGGLDTTVAQIVFGSGIPTRSVHISTDQSWGTSDTGNSALPRSGNGFDSQG